MHIEYIYEKPANYDRATFLASASLTESEVIDDQQRDLGEGLFNAIVVTKEGFTLGRTDVAAIFGG